MSNFPLSGLTYPNRGARALLLGLEDLIGRHGLDTVFKIASLDHWAVEFPPDNLERDVDFAQLTALTHGLIEMYGMRSGPGLARQAVRATFVKTWGDQGLLADLKDQRFTSLPIEQQLEVGGMAAVRVFNELGNTGAKFTTSHGEVSFEFENCPYCVGMKSNSPICGGSAGWVEGVLALIGAESRYAVSEVSCSAMGDTCCKFVVKPLRIE